MSLFVQRCTLPPVCALPFDTPIHFFDQHSPLHRALVLTSYLTPRGISLPSVRLPSRLFSDLVARLPDSRPYVPTSARPSIQPHSADDDIIPHRSVFQHWCIDLHLRVNFSRGSPRRPLSSHRYQTALWGGFVNLTSPPNVLLSPFTSFFEVVDPIDVSCLNWSGQSKAYNSTPHRTCPFKAPSTAGWRSRY